MDGKHFFLESKSKMIECIKTLLLSCMLNVVLCGCISNTDNIKLSWSKIDLSNFTIRLNDPIIEEWYKFNRNKLVSVTLGTKDGELMGPLYSWKLKSGVLFIIDDDGEIFEKLTLIDKNQNSLIVLNKSGKKVRFDILNN